MQGTTNRTRLATLVLAATAAFAVTSCSGGGGGEDKAGGTSEPAVLRLANTNGDLEFTPAVADFVDRVEELSGGNLRIEAADDWGDFASDAEQQVVRDVAVGEIDIGWVGTRVFDTLDVKSFEALTAPMLIDSYALESAVIESGITEEMMRALDDLGVAGLGVLPDGLRRPIGVTRPILGPADWQGLTFGTLKSSGQAEAIRALGATPAQVHRKGRAEGLEDGTIQGFETSIWSHRHDPELAVLAPYVTSNVTLWPQMDVLLANPARLEALTGEQREWLEEAAHGAARSAALADTDARVLGESCASGERFAEASDADLAALEAAFAPVYARLQRQPETKAFNRTHPDTQAVHRTGTRARHPAALHRRSRRANRRRHGDRARGLEWHLPVPAHPGGRGQGWRPRHGLSAGHHDHAEGRPSGRRLLRRRGRNLHGRR